MSNPDTLSFAPINTADPFPPNFIPTGTELVRQTSIVPYNTDILDTTQSPTNNLPITTDDSPSYSLPPYLTPPISAKAVVRASLETDTPKRTRSSSESSGSSDRVSPFFKRSNSDNPSSAIALFNTIVQEIEFYQSALIRELETDNNHDNINNYKHKIKHYKHQRRLHSENVASQAAHITTLSINTTYLVDRSKDEVKFLRQQLETVANLHESDKQILVREYNTFLIEANSRYELEIKRRESAYVERINQIEAEIRNVTYNLNPSYTKLD